MGFLDKVKEQANSLASSVNETVNKGQASLDQSQSRKQADALLRDLGALVYARDTGRGSETTEAEIERLTAALQAHEAQGGAVDLELRGGPAASGQGAGAPPPPAGGTTPPPPGGAAAPAPPAPAAPPPPGAVAPPPPPGTVAPPPPPGSVS